MAVRLQGIVAIAFCSLAIPHDAAFLRVAPDKGQQSLSAPLKSSLHEVQGGFNANNTMNFFHAKTLVAESPDMFVAVMTTRSTPTDKRNAIRTLWKAVDGGQGKICARFIICKADDQEQLNLIAEQSTYGDMLFLHCAEGYAKGLLTKKVIASMRAYREAPQKKDSCLNRQLYMKMDDDTFVAGNRFRAGLHSAISKYGSEFVYAGVDVPGNAPERNVSSPWYEPPSIWPHDLYAPAMYGGPGYILGRTMVQRMIDEKIAESNILWNEDRAVGVWVDNLTKKGVKVTWVRIPGTNGFKWDHAVKTGSWLMYPYTLHHHLSAPCIRCLIAIEKANNAHATVDDCFKLQPKHGIR